MAKRSKRRSKPCRRIRSGKALPRTTKVSALRRKWACKVTKPKAGRCRMVCVENKAKRRRRRGKR